MTTVILILLCLTIAGLELHVAFGRKRPADPVAAAEVADLRRRLADLQPPDLQKLRDELLPALREELRPADPPPPDLITKLQRQPEALRTELRDELNALRAELTARSVDAPQAEVVAGLRDEVEALRGLTSGGERVAALETELGRQEEALRAVDARIRSLVEQINDRMLPEVNGRLAEQRDTTDRLAADVTRLRRHLRRRLEAAVTASLGGDPEDIVPGALGGPVPVPGRAALTEAFERCATAYGLYVELAESGGANPWHARYYLSGASPRELERDFLGLIADLREDPANIGRLPLLGALHQIERSVAQIGPLTVVRTGRALLCGVRPLAELLRRETPTALVKDPAELGRRLRGLPETRFCELQVSGG